MRFIFRSRWAALIWAAGICWTAYSLAGAKSHDTIEAANSADGNAALASALSAEDLE